MTSENGMPATRVHDVVQPLTKSQREVLRLLASGEWTLDRHGSDGMQGMMLGRGGEVRVVSSKTVSRLFSDGLIRTCGHASDFVITDSGKALVG